MLAAYRDHAVCVVNDFRSEIGYRLTLFELLTDEAVTAHLDAKDRELLREVVPWTRAVSHRKTRFRNEEVDLPEFILSRRAEIVLRPSEQMSQSPAYIGADMSPVAWESALQLALRAPYVVQEHASRTLEPVPIFQYGELQIKEAGASVHPSLFNGRWGTAVATLATFSKGYSTPLSLAPLFLLEET